MARPIEFDPNEALDKAIDLFWQKGYEATSIQDLVKTLGISRASLYNTFGDKQSLFLAALDRYQAKSHRRFMVVFEQTPQVREAFETLFTRIVDSSVADTRRRGCLMTNSTVERTPHDPETARRTINNRAWVENAFAMALQRGQANGEVAPTADVQALAQFLFANLQGLRVVSKTKASREELLNIARVALSVLA